MTVLLLLCFLTFVPKTKASNPLVHQHCPISRCSPDGPLIQFPFRLKDDPLDCGNPEFEVSCGLSNNTNVTLIQLSSSSGWFPIQIIDYNNSQFDVYDDGGCMPSRLLNFTTSSLLFYPVPYHRGSESSTSCYDNYDTEQPPYPDYAQSPYLDSAESPSAQSPYSDTAQSPNPEYVRPAIPDSDQSPDVTPSYPYSFRFFKTFTLLNCSTTQNVSRKRDYYMPVRCLSVPGHQVFAVEPSISVADLAPLPISTCTTWKDNFHLPLSPVGDDYTDCEPDNVLLLEWKPWVYFPECQHCNGRCDTDHRRNQMVCYPQRDEYPGQPQPDEYSGYPADYYPYAQAKGHRSMIIGVSMASVVLISAMVVIAVFYYVKRTDTKQARENQIKIEKFLVDHKSHVPTRYSYTDIKKMTNGFKKKLGEGGFGSVYSGKLPSNGVPVAIKVLKDSKGNGDDFVNEVGTIGRIHHVNVVRLLGFSAEEGKRALIYEDMPNSSLEKFITSKDQSNKGAASFDWMKLHKIITGIAKGIEYLHKGCDQRILHFDIKPHNILLDHAFNPKISDFGLAKLCSKEDSVITMTAARGTIGYIAPEVFNGNFGTVSYKSDVYSFGMLVLEVIGARKESAATSADSEVYFPEMIYKRLVEGEQLDLELGDEGDAQIAKRLAIVALWCIQWYPVNRPSMTAVVRMLEGATESIVMPPNPFASTSQREPEISPAI